MLITCAKATAAQFWSKTNKRKIKKTSFRIKKNDTMTNRYTYDVVQCFMCDRDTMHKHALIVQKNYRHRICIFPPMFFLLLLLLLLLRVQTLSCFFHLFIFVLTSLPLFFFFFIFCSFSLLIGKHKIFYVYTQSYRVQIGRIVVWFVFAVVVFLYISVACCRFLYRIVLLLNSRWSSSIVMQKNNKIMQQIYAIKISLQFIRCHDLRHFIAKL